MLFFLLEFARGNDMLHVLFDVAICLPHSVVFFLDVAVLLTCLSLLCVGHVDLLFDELLYMAVCCSMLLYFAKCL